MENRNLALAVVDTIVAVAVAVVNVGGVHVEIRTSYFLWRKWGILIAVLGDNAAVVSVASVRVDTSTCLLLEPRRSGSFQKV